MSNSNWCIAKEIIGVLWFLLVSVLRRGVCWFFGHKNDVLVGAGAVWHKQCSRCGEIDFGKEDKHGTA